MKKVVRATLVIFISILYCFASSIVNSHPAYTHFPAGNTDKTETGNHFSGLSVSLLSYPLQGEKTTNVSFHFPSAPGKKTVDGFVSMVKSTEQICFGVFSQYLIRSADFPIRFRKANIIFPYHYFW